jgi:hypothetical protein
MQLWNPKAFFDKVRAGLLGPTLDQGEVDGCNAILAACAAWPEDWIAYALATGYHETWHTMQPVREVGSVAYFTRMYDPAGNRPGVAKQLGNTQPGDGARFCGRGYSAITGRGNYEKFDRKLGLNGALVANPDLALKSTIAAQILEVGLRNGLFTGVSLGLYLPSDRTATRADFKNARRAVNGVDRADMIAGYALDFRTALDAGTAHG